jgi:hypothetical protein
MEHTHLQSGPPASPWTAPRRAVASLAILVYLAAVVLAPLAAPPPASELAGRLIQPFRPLIGLLHLGHGYRFFAPDPGPGHSIRWTIEMPDGSSRSGSIPDRDGDHPRLLYHRRFMISEKIAALVPPDDAPEAVRQDARREWLPLVKGVAGQLLARHGGTQVTLEMVEHYLPTPEEVIRGGIGSTPGTEDIVIALGSYARSGDPRP